MKLVPLTLAAMAVLVAMVAISSVTGISQETFEIVRAADVYAADLRAPAAGARSDNPVAGPPVRPMDRAPALCDHGRMEPPTLLAWMGGPAALERLLAVFYARVRSDPVLAPVFATMSPDHVAHVAAFIAEVFGGAKTYSTSLGGHQHMIRRHAGRALSEPQRQRWMQLLLTCADEIGVPSDPEFRSAFVGYLEWGTRLAVLNSAPGADVTTSAPMPSWGWGEVKGPYQP